MGGAREVITANTEGSFCRDFQKKKAVRNSESFIVEGKLQVPDQWSALCRCLVAEGCLPCHSPTHLHDPALGAKAFSRRTPSQLVLRLANQEPPGKASPLCRKGARGQNSPGQASVSGPVLMAATAAGIHPGPHFSVRNIKRELCFVTLAVTFCVFPILYL